MRLCIFLLASITCLLRAQAPPLPSYFKVAPGASQDTRFSPAARMLFAQQEQMQREQEAQQRRQQAEQLANQILSGAGGMTERQLDETLINNPAAFGEGVEGLGNYRRFRQKVAPSKADEELGPLFLSRIKDPYHAERFKRRMLEEWYSAHDAWEAYREEEQANTKAAIALAEAGVPQSEYGALQSNGLFDLVAVARRVAEAKRESRDGFSKAIVNESLPLPPLPENKEAPKSAVEPGEEGKPLPELTANLDQIAAALKHAESVGDTEGARLLADYHQRLADAKATVEQGKQAKVMSQYLVELEDGRKFQVEADHPPTNEEVHAYLAAQTQNDSGSGNDFWGTGKDIATLGIAVGLIFIFWLMRAMKDRTVQSAAEKAASKTHATFILRLVFTMGAYGGVTFWLNAVRPTAAMWLLWVLIGVQLFLFLSIFVVCSLRAKECGFRHTWLFFIPLLLSRVNDWEITVLPLMALVMWVFSARQNGSTNRLPLSWMDLVAGAAAWAITEKAGLISTVIKETGSLGDARLAIGAIIGCGSVALGMYSSRAIRRAMKSPTCDAGSVCSPEPICREQGKLDSDVLGYELLSQELECGKRDEVLWLKSYSEADGDKVKAEAAYNRARAAVLAKDYASKEDVWKRARAAAEQQQQPRSIIIRS